MDRPVHRNLLSDPRRLALKQELHGLAMELAILRLWWTCVKASFNPAQPRVPAGSPDGGQWTGTGTSIDRPVRIAEGRKWRYTVFLQDQEGHGGSHTIRAHVGKTDVELMERMETGRWQTLLGRGTPLRDGTFRTLSDANDLVNRVLEDNTKTIDAVASGELPDAFLKRRFGFPTGREAFRPLESGPAYLRTTYEVGVLIVHDPSMRNGFRVHTAYPRNSLPGENAMTDAPLAFYKFCEAIIQDLGIFRTREDFYSFALRPLTPMQRSEFSEFIARYNDGQISDAQMKAFFNRSQSEYHISDPRELREFLTDAAAHTKKPLKGKLDLMDPYSEPMPPDQRKR